MPYRLERFTHSFELVTERGDYRELLEIVTFECRKDSYTVYRIVSAGRVLMYFIDGHALTADEVIAHLLFQQAPPKPAETPTAGPSMTPFAGPTATTSTPEPEPDSLPVPAPEPEPDPEPKPDPKHKKGKVS